MLKTFTALTPFIKFRPKDISIDNVAFKFHYRATYLLLLVCVLIVTSRQYIGEHIRCITDSSIPSHVINSFCFFTPTFTVIRHYNQSMLDSGHLPHPGVGHMMPSDSVKHHAYYQWVPFLLVIQAICFYTPHFVWRICEGGRIKGLVMGLQRMAVTKYNEKGKDTIKGRIDITKNYFYKHIRINKQFARQLIFCELLNLVNLLLQIYLTNEFLSGQFYTLGFKFIEDDFRGRMDVLDTIFPKMTKCDFFKYGQSGSIQRHDALCVMALNVVHEKIYVVLWFWFIIMLFITIGSIIWRLTTVILFASSMWFNRMVFSSACPGRINCRQLNTVIENISFSDWIFLYYLAKNMDSILFCELLSDLAAEFQQNHVDERETLRFDDIGENSSIEKENIDEVDLRRK